TSGLSSPQTGHSVNVDLHPFVPGVAWRNSDLEIVVRHRERPVFNCETAADRPPLRRAESAREPLSDLAHAARAVAYNCARHPVAHTRRNRSRTIRIGKYVDMCKRRRFQIRNQLGE